MEVESNEYHQNPLYTQQNETQEFNSNIDIHDSDVEIPPEQNPADPHMTAAAATTAHAHLNNGYEIGEDEIELELEDNISHPSQYQTTNLHPNENTRRNLASYEGMNRLAKLAGELNSNLDSGVGGNNGTATSSQDLHHHTQQQHQPQTQSHQQHPHQNTPHQSNSNYHNAGNHISSHINHLQSNSNHPHAGIDNHGFSSNNDELAPYMQKG